MSDEITRIRQRLVVIEHMMCVAGEDMLPGTPVVCINAKNGTKIAYSYRTASRQANAIQDAIRLAETYDTHTYACHECSTACRLTTAGDRPTSCPHSGLLVQWERS